MTKLEAFRYKLLIVFVLAAGVLFFHFARRDVESHYSYDKLALIARFAAKEYCSCRFVVEQSEDYCRNFIDLEIPLFGYRVRTSKITRVSSESISGSDRKTTARALYFIQAIAKYTPLEGCRLLP